MKKAFPYLLTLALFTSCTKKTDNITTTEGETVTDSLNNTTTSPSVKNSAPTLKEWSAEKVGNLVAAKNNDTLYVTNFFATWCGPCVRELPHFKNNMDKMKGQPVKFTFVSLDQVDDWAAKVPAFSQEHGISENVILLNGENLGLDFFRTNFKKWDGGSIPFTIFSKNGKIDEVVGSMSEEVLNEKLNQF